MTIELTVRVADPEATEATIRKAGACFTREQKYHETYFNQPNGRFLRLVRTAKRNTVQILEGAGEGFRIVSQETIQDVEAFYVDMIIRYGVKCVLEKEQRNFLLDSLIIRLVAVKKIGTFLCCEGEDIDSTIFSTRLGLKKIEIVKGPLCDMMPSLF